MDKKKKLIIVAGVRLAFVRITSVIKNKEEGSIS